MAKKTVASLREEIASLEAKLAGEVTPQKQISAAEQTRRRLLAEIKSLESRVACMGQPMVASIEAPVVLPNEVAEEDMDMFMDDEADCTASIQDPDGIEESISDDYLSEVAKLVKKDGLSLDDIDEAVDFEEEGVGVTSSEQRIALLERATARLDRVASYCEKHGRVKLAFRIDQIADSVDARIEQEKV